MSDLSTAGRRGRLAATAVVGALLLAGTVAGEDDHFPFAPFRMYASAHDPDAPAPDTRVEGVDAAGRTVVLTEANSGIRRAEIEGQQGAYVADPSRLRQIAAAYAEHSPGAAALTEVRLVVRWHGIEDARPTGKHTDEVVARWVAP
jgi:hypothetical protein